MQSIYQLPVCLHMICLIYLPTACLSPNDMPSRSTNCLSASIWYTFYMYQLPVCFRSMPEFPQLAGRGGVGGGGGGSSLQMCSIMAQGIYLPWSYTIHAVRETYHSCLFFKVILLPWVVRSSTLGEKWWPKQGSEKVVIFHTTNKLEKDKKMKPEKGININ
jgi:hypothetical protein